MEVDRVSFHSDAIEDARAAWLWYRDRSSTAANRFLSELDRAVEQIQELPDRWPSHKHSSRRYVMHRFPYCVVYRVLNNDSIHVIAVTHFRRRPGYWKRRR